MSSYYDSSYGLAAGGMMIFQLILSLGAGIIMLIATWRLFEKAGEPGWKCLIPFYGTYIWFKIVWETKYFWITYGLLFGAWIIGLFFGLTTVNAGRDSIQVVAILFAVLALGIGIGALVLSIKMLIHTAHAYGQSSGFAAGLFFLTPIFYCILAFGSSEYVGPMGISSLSGRQAENGNDPNAVNDSAAGANAAGTIAMGSGAAAPAAKNTSRASLIWVIVAAGALILGIGALLRIYMSMVKFNMLRGLFGSPWIGFQNFERILRSPQLSSILVNSLVYGLFAVVVSVLFSLLGGAAGMSRSPIGKAVAVGFGMILAFLPPLAYACLIILQPDLTVRMNLLGSGEFNPLLPLLHVLPYGGISLVLGALLPGLWKEKRFNGVWIAPLLTLTMFFLDRNVTDPLSNPLNRQFTETLSLFAYQRSILNGQFAYGAVTEVLQSLLNFLPLVLGAVMIAILVKKTRPAAETLPRQSSAAPSVVAGAIAGGLTLLGGILLFAAPIFSDSGTVRAALSGLLTALLTAVLAFGVYLAVLVCAGRFDAGKWIPLALLIGIFAGFNRHSVIAYTVAGQAGVLDTVIMPVLSAVVNPLSLMLIIGMILLRPRQVSTCVLFALGAAFLSAAYVMGDVSSCVLYVSRSGNWNLAALLYRTMMSPAAANETLSLEAVRALAPEQQRTAMLGAMLLFSALPLGIGSALCFLASQRENGLSVTKSEV